MNSATKTLVPLAGMLCILAACDRTIDLGKEGAADLGGAADLRADDSGAGPGAPDAGVDAEARPQCGPEQCNGVDDNCDGVVDEGCACTPGMDQTCNDSDLVSAIWGSCHPDGSCSCIAGFEINPATGRCRPAATPGDCTAQIAALAAEMYTPPARSCTAVLRLDHDTLQLLGFQLVCGGYGGVDEATARATAQADTGYGATGNALNGANPNDAYVFYQAPGDFGGAAAVSARTGLSVFGGSIIWMGQGDVTYPKTWRPVADLGSNCPPVGTSTGPVQATGYDLVNGQSLSKAETDAAAKVLEQTALPAAMWQGGYVFDVVVLRYPRSVGAFDPTTAEWIVLLNGGWLE